MKLIRINLLSILLVCFAWPTIVSANSDLRPMFSSYLLEVKDQEERPTCSINAMTALLEFEHSKHTGSHPLVLSREYLNWAANDATGIVDDGSFFSHIIRGLKENGVCEEQYMPYSSTFDPNNTPSNQAISDADSRSEFYIAFVKTFNDNIGLSQYQVDEIKKLLDRGYPIAIGAKYPDNSQYDSDYVLQMPDGTENFIGHSVIIVGYFDDINYSGGGVFIIRNSWGPNWLDHDGHAKIPYGYYELYGNDALAIDVGTSQPGLPFIQKNNTIEFEDMDVLQATSDYAVQNMEGFGANVWSEDNHLFIGNQTVGQYIEFSLNAVKAKKYSINLFVTKAPDFGIFDFSINGKKLLENFDAFSQLVQPSERIKLGKISLSEGMNILRVELKGKSNSSGGYQFGLDFLEVLPIPDISIVPQIASLLLLSKHSSIPTVTSATGQVWMDRNLGASRVATSLTDEEAYGDLYQWGRGTDGHEKRISQTNINRISPDTGHGDFVIVPVFLTTTYDWHTPQDETLWQGVDGENNPCPIGFRLPTREEWMIEMNTYSALKLPAAGYRGFSDGIVRNEGTKGFYWSMTSNKGSDSAPSYSVSLSFASPETSGDISEDAFRAVGGSVRCIKD